MAWNPEHIATLISSYNKGELTTERQAELDAWLAESPRHAALFQELTDPATLRQWLLEANRFDEGKVWEQISTHTSTTPVRRLPKRSWRWLAAASVIGLLLAGYWLLQTTDEGPRTTDPSIVLQADVKAPDKNRAQIRLADGTTVYLDSAANGELFAANGVKLVKTGDGEVVYRTTDDGPLTMEYNTLTNPRGSKVIDMTLSDGSRVWLNAGSSITYPVAFAGRERKVEMTGEAYFEVSTKYEAGSTTLKQPFLVSKGELTVTVLGTHFNVNAYEDEKEMKVTLLEGSVKVESRQSSVVLKPGEQVVSMVSGEWSINKTVDLEQVMAWKNGRFEFGEKTPIQEILRQVARWYDVDIEYQGNVNQQFWVSVSRQENVSKILEKLALTGRVQFKIEGRRIIVRP
jgi:transmembrane sensor